MELPRHITEFERRQFQSTIIITRTTSVKRSNVYTLQNTISKLNANNRLSNYPHRLNKTPIDFFVEVSIIS